MGPSKYIEPLLAQKELTEHEVLLRREFAKLFVHSDNAYSACKALGFAEPYIMDWARELMNCCVVYEFIQEERAYRNSEEGLKDAAAKVLSKLEELGNYNGPGASHGARVTAWVNYGKFIGMNQDEKSEIEVLHKGGVMMVPAMTNPDEWGKLASQSQANLKDTVRE